MTISLRSDIAVIPPFDPGIFDFLAARAVEGIEAVDNDGGSWTYTRALRLTGGDCVAEVSWSARRPEKLDVVLHLETEADAGEALKMLARLFDTSTDPRPIDRVLGADPLMAPRVALRPGIRVPGHLDANEIVIRALVGQQITVIAATTILGRLASVGKTCRVPHPRVTRLFPTPGEMAAKGRDVLRGPARRTETMLNVTSMMSTGELQPGSAGSVEELSAMLLPLPGIGPWTVNYVAMRTLGSPDIHLKNDAAVRAGLAFLGVEDEHAYLQRFRPWRSYATMHIWRAALQAPRARRRT